LAFNHKLPTHCSNDIVKHIITSQWVAYDCSKKSAFNLILFWPITNLETVLLIYTNAANVDFHISWF